MKARDVVLKIMENLPKHSESFSSFFVPEDVTVSGKTVTVTKPYHRLHRDSNGIPPLISVSGVKLANSIASIDDNGDGFHTVTCDARTDITLEQTTVRIESISTPAIDGNYLLDGMDSGSELIIAGYSYSGALPADAIVVENREVSYNGLHAVTVIDSNSFSFENHYLVNNNLNVIVETMKVHNEVRVSRSATIDGLIAHYDAQPPTELVAWVVLGGTSINKDEKAYSDADMEQGNLNEWEGMLLTPFHVYVFQTLSDDATGGAARDDMTDVRSNLYSVLLGQSFSGNTVAGVENVVYPIGDNSYQYKKGYYVHDFEFGQTIMISREDTASDSLQPTVAMDSISFDFVDDKQLKLISGQVDLQF